jgi:Mlc titration factor MtfA (ptsG expression regulator)
VLILGLDVDYYREVSAIVVYPTTIVSRGTYAGPVVGTVTDDVFPVLGQAHDRRGPVLLAWDEVLESSHHPGHARNVVFHEFAHKIDMLDDLVDGTPPLEFKEQLARWVEVCTRAYTALREGEPVPPLDPYGGTSVAEFFAVATEAFFDAPVKLEQHQPDLYEIFRGFYKQDAAERARRT